MKKNLRTTSLAISICGVMAGSAGIASGKTVQDQSPFSVNDLGTGYMTVDAHEGKCGEGKCGGKKEKEGKCGEGKCGGKKEKEGKCGEGKCGGKKEKEGKCGEGKCGGKS